MSTNDKIHVTGAASGSPKQLKKARTSSGKGNGQALSREAVVAAALMLVDRDGLEAFSIRSLASELGVYPTAVYWYVPDRNEILAEVVSLSLAGVLPTVRRRSWQRWLRDLFANFRSCIRSHPNVAPLIASQIVSNSMSRLEFVDEILAALVRAGFAGPSLVGAYNSVLAALVGFTAQEFAPMPTGEREAWQQHVEMRVLATDASLYPTLARNLHLLSNRAFTLRWQNGVEAPMDDSFAIFVDMVVAGLERLVRPEETDDR